MKCIKQHFKHYCNNIYNNCGIRCFWSIDNSQEFIGKVENVEGKSIFTFDFSTLYTNLPQSNILEALTQLIYAMYKNANGKYINVNMYTGTGYWSYNRGNRCKSFDIDELITAIEFILNNRYVRFGPYIFKQIKGIPMGGNCSPLLADLYLAWLEYVYIKQLMNNNYELALQLSNCCRYIDDIAVPNFTKFLEVS